MTSDNPARHCQSEPRLEVEPPRPLLHKTSHDLDRGILDWKQLKERFDGETSLIRELTELFRSDLDAKLEALHSAQKAADGREIERLAHTMRGAVANFDSPLSVQLLHQLELDARTGNAADLKDRVAEIERVLRRLLDLLESKLGQEEASPPLS
jgi:HPt (histidine-containing phosphotransfer) domain-containing protein